jgi:hypothetical protein
VTLADLIAGTLPAEVRDLTEVPDAWVSRTAASLAPPPPPPRAARPRRPLDTR